MARFCLSTVVYPGAEKFYNDFFKALDSVEGFADADFVIARHGDVDLGTVEPTDVVEIEESVSPAGVRHQLFEYLKQSSNADIYVFTDIDDRVRPDAFALHQQALNGEEGFSYGDQALYGADFTQDLGKTLFDRFDDIPPCLGDAEELMRRNYAGLSALALSKGALEAVPTDIPPVPAVDWWLVSHLLLRGVHGKRAGAVTDYRLGPSAEAALKPASDAAELARKLKIVEAHFAHLPDIAPVLEQRQALNSLKNNLESDPQSVERLAKEVLPAHILWYEDVILLASRM